MASRLLSGEMLDKLYGLRLLWESVRWYRRWRTFPIRPWLDAARFFRRGDFHQAAASYISGLSLYPEHPAADSARFDMAYCYYRLDQPQKALAALRIVLSRKAPIADAYLLCAKILLSLGRAVSAVRILENGKLYFREDPRIASALMHSALNSNLGSQELRSIQSELLVIKSKLQLEEPGNNLIDTALAHYELLHGDERRGDRLLARVLASGFSSLEAVLLRAERLIALGRAQQGHDQLTRAIRIAPKDPRPLVSLARFYRSSGSDFRPAWAVALAESACRLTHWQNSSCIHALAAAYEASAETGKAELYLELAKRLRSCAELTPALLGEEKADLRKVSND